MRGAIARVQNGGQATVEQRVEAAEREAREAREAAAKLKAELEQQRSEEQAAHERQAAEYRLNELRDTYASTIDENHHPFLSLLDPAEVAERGLFAANAYATQVGLVPPADEVIQFLEDQERAAFEARATKAGWTKAQAAAAVQAATAAPAPSGGVDTSDNPAPARGGLTFSHSADGAPGAQAQGVTRDTSGRFVPRAATNSQAAARGTAPADWRGMSERERIARAGAEVFGRR